MENHRNWLELPSDIMLTILMKIPQLNILESVQFVCKPWYDLCKEPSMWRSIKFKNLKRRFMPASVAEGLDFQVHNEPKRLVSTEPKMVFDHEKMVFHAVDRSDGGLVDLDIEDFVPYWLISYVASQSIQLKRFRLSNCYDLSGEALIEALGKLTHLDELVLTLCCFGKVSSVIKSCPPSLTTLKLNKCGSRESYRASDKVALVIAESLPQLRHLQLRGNDMTNVGLVAILDRCLHLQSLDVRECFHLDHRGDLGKKIPKHLADLQLLYDSAEDYDYSTSDYDDYDSDDIPYVDYRDFLDYYDDLDDYPTFDSDYYYNY